MSTRDTEVGVRGGGICEGEWRGRRIMNIVNPCVIKEIFMYIHDKAIYFWKIEHHLV